MTSRVRSKSLAFLGNGDSYYRRRITGSLVKETNSSKFQEPPSLWELSGGFVSCGVHSLAAVGFEPINCCVYVVAISSIFLRYVPVLDSFDPKTRSCRCSQGYHDRFEKKSFLRRASRAMSH